MTDDILDSDSEGSKQVSEWRRLRNRVIAGLFVILPIYITYVVVKWLYEILYDNAIGPIATYLREVTFKDAGVALEDAGVSLNDAGGSWGAGEYILYILSVVLALFIVLSILIVAGVFAKSRLLRATEWTLQKVPGVNTIYRVVSNVFNAISVSQDTTDFKRVVLVAFPHPGIRVPAFVTSECVDSGSGKTILCVYVPTTPVPTSGYMLLVPEEDVMALDWNLEETLQAIVSGGISAPKKVNWS
jgi:uncharacterized membrane protein